MPEAGERFAAVGEIELCYQTFGRPSDPALLLIAGLGAQMLLWEDDFCRALAKRGFWVIRFDNRDMGRSTKIAWTVPANLGQAIAALKPAKGYPLPTCSRTWPATRSGCWTRSGSRAPMSRACRWAA